MARRLFSRHRQRREQQRGAAKGHGGGYGELQIPAHGLDIFEQAKEISGQRDLIDRTGNPAALNAVAPRWQGKIAADHVRARVPALQVCDEQAVAEHVEHVFEAQV